jgi:hypothetical protein
MNRPEIGEYDPYYNTYISLVEGDNVLSLLESQPEKLRSILQSVSEDRGTFAYGEGKWTIKELLSHVIDGERIFGYRALRISRGDETPIEGFEQDGYIENSNANNRSFSDLLDEFELSRRANMLMLNAMSSDAGTRMGTASERTISVRALVYIMAGHVEHHFRILRERYLS